MDEPMKYIEKKYLGLYLGMMANFIFFGVTLAVPGMLLPGIIRDFGWSYTWAGVVLASGSVGYFFSTFLCGFLVHKFSARTVMCGGLIVQSFGLLLFGAWSPIFLNIIMNFLLGFGQGGTEVVTNYSVVRMEREKEHHLMGMVHAGFSVGAVMAPLIGGFFLSGGAHWRTIFIGAAVISFVLVLVTWFLPFRCIAEGETPIRREEISGGPQNRAESSIPRLMIVFSVVTILLYVGIEIGISNWISEYFVTILGSSKSSASFAVSLFWGGILAGRVLIPLLIRKPTLTAQLVGLTCILTLSILATVLFSNPIVLSASFLLAGIGCSSIYPLVMTLVGRHYRRKQSIYLGFVSTGGGIGAFIIPMIMAGLADVLGLRLGFAFFGGLGVVLVFFAIGIRRQVTKLQLEE